MNTETPLDMQHSTPALFASLAIAQGQLENASKTARNDHYRSNYADLAECLNRVRPVLSANGISVIQSPSFDGSQVHCETILAHSEGGWIAGRLSCVPAKTDGQGVGAATTYLRRYSLAAMVGLAQQDDDGQAAAHDRKPSPAAPPAARKKAAPPAGPTAAEMKAALREAYQKAGIASGYIAEAVMRKAGHLAEGQHVPDLDLDGLRRAYSARETMFADTAGESGLILDNDEPPA